MTSAILLLAFGFILTALFLAEAWRHERKVWKAKRDEQRRRKIEKMRRAYERMLK